MDLLGVPSISVHARPALRPLRPRRLLVLAGDERLVEQIRAGNEAAFEVAFQRHGPAILSFCRHMLRSRDDAEDVVQHTFAAAYSALLAGEREIALKPWLFAIARNRCVSLLRRPRHEAAESAEPSTAGLTDEVERRAGLRELLGDVAQLPAEQRASLLLVEIGDLSHAEVAEVLGCEVSRVKALVYRARQSLIERRDARATPCEEIREQLANLRGGALRRSELRHHLRDCPGCVAFRAKVKQQRGMLAAALPVMPSAGLKTSVLAAVGLGSGPAAGGAGVAALGATGTAVPGAGILAKVAIVSVLAAGGTVAGEELTRGGAVGPPRGAETAAPDPSAGAPAPITPLEIDSIGSRPDTGGSARPRAGGPPARSPGRERGRTTSDEARTHKPVAPQRPAIPGNRAQSQARRPGQGGKQGAAHHSTGTPPAAHGRPARSGHAEQAEREAKAVGQGPGGGRQGAVPEE
jgi:RNA polymerase sigma factor (sigma-70 family)